MPKIRLTSKRQATLPKSFCEELNLQPGDSLLVERGELHGESVWFLRPEPKTLPGWFGALRSYAEDKTHEMEAIRESIEQARREGRLGAT